ncbi:MAG: DNA polymerase III subunit beta [Planctomycetaceae bacterium]
MKLHCHRPALTTAFQVVGGVVPTRTPKDILRSVKLQSVDGTVTLTGTDTEVGIRYEIPGVEAEGNVTALVPAARMMSILRELTDDAVVLEITEDAVWVRSGGSEFKLSAADPEEFPEVAAFQDAQYHRVPGRVLREMIRRTVFATDEESTRYALGGVLVELKADSIALAATDSRRLAVTTAACQSDGVEAGNVNPVVPSKAMQLIERSIAEDDDEVWLAVHQNDVVVRCGASTISSQLVQGRFPRYADVIPRAADAKSVIDLVVGPFYSAVRQAQIVTDEESRGVDFVFGDGKLTLISQAADVGQSRIEVPIPYDGEELKILFDPRFVAEFLRVLEPEQQVRLHLIDAESAAVFRVADAYTYVVMPLSRDR